jgi:hypothetical protein
VVLGERNIHFKDGIKKHVKVGQQCIAVGGEYVAN